MFAFTFFYALLIITSLVNVAHAQNQTKAATDPNEGAPISSISLSLSLSLNVVFFALLDCIQLCCA